MTEWYYIHEGEQRGPVPSATLKDLARAGLLRPDSLIWKHGLNEWVSAREVKGLFPHEQPKPPPLPGRSPDWSQAAPVVQPSSVIPSRYGGSFHGQRIAMACTAGAGMLATFLPWIHVPLLGSMNGTAGDGWITLALFVPAFVLAFVGRPDRSMTGACRTLAAIPALAGSAIGVFKIVQFHSSFKARQPDNPFAEAMMGAVQIGAGLYLLIVAGLAVAIAAVCMGDRRRARDPVRRYYR